MTNTNPAPAIELSAISKAYGKKQVLSSVSLTVTKGECIGILGANGCGKSTLLAILSGCLPADKGSVSFFEKTARTKRDFASSTGYVPQDNPLFSSLTVSDNLRYFYADSNTSLKEDLTDGVPKLFGLDACLKTRVKHLSGGMKRRLAIACALAAHPPVLLLDEPGASLDFVSKEDIYRYLMLYREQGGTILLTSHEQAEIALCDRLFLLENGTLTSLEPDFDIRLLAERIRSHETI